MGSNYDTDYLATLTTTPDPLQVIEGYIDDAEGVPTLDGLVAWLSDDEAWDPPFSEEEIAHIVGVAQECGL